jgi:hypothetical protein
VIVIEPVRMWRRREIVIGEVKWTHTCHEESACRGKESACSVEVEGVLVEALSLVYRQESACRGRESV